MALNFLRAMIDGGFADLRRSERWSLADFNDDAMAHQYASVIQEMRGALGFIDALHLGQSDRLRRIDLYTSHEGLILDYEETQTRFVPPYGRPTI